MNLNKETFSLQVDNYEIIVNFFQSSHDLTWYSAIVHKSTRIYPVCSTYELAKQFMWICVKNCAIDLKQKNLYYWQYLLYHCRIAILKQWVLQLILLLTLLCKGYFQCSKCNNAEMIPEKLDGCAIFLHFSLTLIPDFSLQRMKVRSLK